MPLLSACSLLLLLYDTVHEVYSRARTYHSNTLGMAIIRELLLLIVLRLLFESGSLSRAASDRANTGMIICTVQRGIRVCIICIPESGQTDMIMQYTVPQAKVLLITEHLLLEGRIGYVHRPTVIICGIVLIGWFHRRGVYRDACNE